ncbi:MAG TPA: hypothetical protein PLQ44_02890 [Candidatus Paceibacterota bacterium]|nr:hypothetical protein [Candidatus Paceibacterota bacterium]
MKEKQGDIIFFADLKKLIGNGAVFFAILDIQFTTGFGSTHTLRFSQFFRGRIDPDIGVVVMSFLFELILQLV